MNERIIGKLANDAWVDVPEGQGYGGKIFSKEKFAELIVKECFRVATQKEDGDTSDYNSGRSWAGIDILKHFGVEE